MKDEIDLFFNNKNMAKGVSEYENIQMTNYLETIAAFSRTTYKSIYVIDYIQKGFEYVSDNPLFLCGHTPEEVRKMGYAFFFKNVEKEDLNLLSKINTIGFEFYDNVSIEERKRYTISYDFKLKRKNENKYILINQKLTPLFLTHDGKIWKSICIVSLSTEKESGNIKIYKKGNNKIFKYDLQCNVWKTEEKKQLSDREKEILQLSARGFTINEISEKIYVTSDTVKFHRRKIYDKLEVSNISEAIMCAINNKLI